MDHRRTCRRSSATNPDITSAGCDVCNRVALQGAVDVAFVFSDLGFTSVAVVHDNSDYGKGLAEIFQNNIIDLGAELTSFEGVQVGDTDFRAMLARVGAAGPQVIFFSGLSTEAGLIAQQMTEISGLEDTAFMSVDGAYTQQYLQAAVAAVDDKGNLVIDREELIAAIRSVDAFAGLTGTIKCDSIGECGAGGIQIFQVTDGAFVQVSGFGME